MSAVTLQGGSLSGHLDAVAAQIRRHPGDADLRAQLFQLLAAQGEWERASEQLRLCAELNPQAAPMALMYDRAMGAERRREAVLAGDTAEPFFPGPRPAWADMLLQALRRQAGAPEESTALRTAALAAADAKAGVLHIEGQAAPQAFQWIGDGDSRLGPVLECIVGEQYAWLPFSHVRRVRLLPPEGLCDLVWAQAEITLADGRVLHGLIPARYPAGPGQRLADQADGVKLGRVTEWVPLHGDCYAGVGQKTWITDQGEHPLLDTRVLEHD
jgi:type VI secretion system protein ImpE